MYFNVELTRRNRDSFWDSRKLSRQSSVFQCKKDTWYEGECIPFQSLPQVVVDSLIDRNFSWYYSYNRVEKISLCGDSRKLFEFLKSRVTTEGICSNESSLFWDRDNRGERKCHPMLQHLRCLFLSLVMSLILCKFSFSNRVTNGKSDLFLLLCQHDSQTTRGNYNKECLWFKRDRQSFNTKRQTNGSEK